MERLEKIIAHLPKAADMFAKLYKNEADVHLEKTTDACACVSGTMQKKFFYVTTEDKAMYMLRKNTSGIIEDIADYGPIHLNYSIIKDVAIRSPGTTIAQTHFVLYYHWLYRYHKSYDNLKQEPRETYINRNICLSLEDIISMVAEKENTLYKEFNTTAIMQAYRFLCSKIRCMDSIQNINLRR